MSFESANYSVAETKFGDHVVTIEPEYLEFFRSRYDCDKNTILLMSSSLNENFCDFEYECTHNDKYLYLNEKCRKTCIRLFDGKASGSSLTLVLKCNDEIYYVFVKDRTRKQYTSICGVKNLAKETYEECAVRECYEECELSIDINNLTKFATFGFDSALYGQSFPGNTVGFYTILNVEQSTINKLLSFSNEEIENISLVSESELEKISIEKYSLHHILMAKWVKGKLTGILQTNIINECPNYIKDFNLF